MNQRHTIKQAQPALAVDLCKLILIFVLTATAIFAFVHFSPDFETKPFGTHIEQKQPIVSPPLLIAPNQLAGDTPTPRSERIYIFDILNYHLHGINLLNIETLRTEFENMAKQSVQTMTHERAKQFLILIFAAIIMGYFGRKLRPDHWSNLATS